MYFNKSINNISIVTLTWPHWSWKDTLIDWWIQNIKNSKKVVSNTNRLPRKWEIPWYTYNYNEIISNKEDIFDWITLPSLNTRTWNIWVDYWINNSYVDSIFDDNSETLYLWHAAPSIIKKLITNFKGKFYSIYLETDHDLLIERLKNRDNLTSDQASHRLNNDPWNINSYINKWINNKIFNEIIKTNKSKEEVLLEFLNYIK